MSEFRQMRARLQSEGLIDAGFRLTDAGNARVRSIISSLRQKEAPSDPSAPRVFWLHDFRQRRR